MLCKEEKHLKLHNVH